MTFKEYQAESRKTVVYPRVGEHSWIYPALGLCGEVGEILEKLKRVLRDGAQIDKEALKKELGDVLWYLSSLAAELGIELEDVAITNIQKLTSRIERGCLHGNGDER